MVCHTPVLYMNERFNVGKVTTSVKIKRGLWNVACIVLFRPLPTKVFRLWRIALLRLFGADISWSADVYSSAKIWAPWNLRMEDGACLGPGTICYNQALVDMHAGATVSQYTYLCTAGHLTDDDNSSQSGLVVSPITIKAKGWIGTRAYIHMGVVIGEHAIVGAAAAVYKDVEPWTIVGGNPAKKIRTRYE